MKKSIRTNRTDVHRNLKFRNNFSVYLKYCKTMVKTTKTSQTFQFHYLIFCALALLFLQLLLLYTSIYGHFSLIFSLDASLTCVSLDIFTSIVTDTSSCVCTMISLVWPVIFSNSQYGILFMTEVTSYLWPNIIHVRVQTTRWGRVAVSN